MSTVLLTGASGFLGAHTVRHLLDAGHRVRSYVRDPARLDEALAPLGLSAGDAQVEVARGDMTDGAAVREAVAGCTSVIHAAATYSFRRRDREAMRRDNTVGTRTVLEAGRDAGCRPLVHVSSTVALTRPGGAVLDEHSPVGPGVGAYSASKAASERVARELQEAGGPVTIVNPGTVLGPHDPYLGESNEIIAQILRGMLPVFPSGRFHIVDVRDTAAVLTAAIAHEPGGRYLVPGESVADLHAATRAVSGRRLPLVRLPARLAEALTLPGYLTGWSLLPGSVEGVRISGCANTVDSTATTRDLGVSARPLTESVLDTVRWLVAAGHVSARQAGHAQPAA